MTQELSTQTATISPIDWLFGELHGMYGNQFFDKFRSGHIVDGLDTGIENMKRVWTEKIRSNGMKIGDLRRALSACERVKFPPSWSEFLELCKPSVDVLAAYYEAVNGSRERAAGKMGEWSHPAIFWASMPMAFDISNQSYSQVKARWESALHEQLACGEWAEIPQPMIALPAPGQTKLSREEAEKLVRQYQAMDATKKEDCSIDHRRWAHRIMKRFENGDKNLRFIEVTFAKDALGLQ